MLADFTYIVPKVQRSGKIYLSFHLNDARACVLSGTLCCFSNIYVFEEMSFRYNLQLALSVSLPPLSTILASLK